MTYHMRYGSDADFVFNGLLDNYSHQEFAEDQLVHKHMLT